MPSPRATHEEALYTRHILPRRRRAEKVRRHHDCRQPPASVHALVRPAASNTSSSAAVQHLEMASFKLLAAAPLLCYLTTLGRHHRMDSLRCVHQVKGDARVCAAQRGCRGIEARVPASAFSPASPTRHCCPSTKWPPPYKCDTKHKVKVTLRPSVSSLLPTIRNQYPPLMMADMRTAAVFTSSSTQQLRCESEEIRGTWCWLCGQTLR